MQRQNTSSKSHRNTYHEVPHPDPILAAEGLSITIVERFWSKVQKTDGCWNWTGAWCDSRGGVICRGANSKIGKGNIGARRVCYLIHYGPLPKGRLFYTCGNIRCLNPTHLRLKNGEPLPPYDKKAIKRAESLAVNPRQDPDLPEGFWPGFLRRFWKYVKKTDSCWYWTGHVNQDGYGLIGMGGKSGSLIGAHRAAYLIFKGPIATGFCVMHNCPGGIDHPNCVNPDHLHLGTKTDNLIDAIQKRRSRTNSFWHCKLTPEQVSEMCRLHKAGMSIGQISRLVHTSRTNASKIVKGRGWRHISSGAGNPAPEDYMI